VVATDIQQVMAEDNKMGMCLNSSKSEVISHPHLQITDQTLLSFNAVSVANATLLGLRFSMSKFWMIRGRLVAST